MKWANASLVKGERLYQVLPSGNLLDSRKLSPQAWSQGLGALCRCACPQWVPVVTLLSWGCCNSCQWSGAGSGSGGRHLPGLSPEWKNRRQLHSGTRTGAEDAETMLPTSSHACFPNTVPLGWAGNAKKAVLVWSWKEWLMLKQLPSCVTEMLEQGGAGWEHQPFISRMWSFKALWSLPMSQQPCK